MTRRIDRLTEPRRVVVILVVVLLVGGVWLAVAGGSEDGRQTGPSGPDVVTVEVERRVLETVLLTRGTVISPAVASVVAPSPGEGEFAVVVTGLPSPPGAEIGAGAVVVELNGRPVLALPSAIPLFRDIRPGQEGPDVEALQAALHAMGYSIPSSELARLGPRTQAAVEAVYADAGYEARYTLGDKAAVTAALAEADRRVSAARTAVDVARAAGIADPAAEAELVLAQGARDLSRATEGVVLAASEVLASPILPATLVDLPVSEGQQVEPGTQVATIGSAEFQVQIELTAAQVNELAPDVVIEVDSSSGYLGSCTPGTPQEAAAPPAGSDAEGSSPAGEAIFQMVVACSPLPPVESLGESLRARLTVRRSEGPVLVVPSTAITTTASGESYVEVVDAAGQVRRVPVTVGGEADGFNAVEPVTDSLDEGDMVRVRRR